MDTTGPRVRYDPERDALLVDGLVIDDAEVLREATRWTSGERGEAVTDPDALAVADLTPFAAEVIGVGARVLSIAGQSSDTLAVQQVVRAASDQVDDAVRRATETLGASTREASAALLAEVARLVGGESPELLLRLQPVLDQVGTNLESQVAAAVGKATEATKAETDRRHTELTDLIQEVRRDVAVRIATDETAAAVRGVTTIKGFDYEAQAHAICHEIAASLGDEYRETGDRAGRLPRNKKGDGIFAISGDIARIVVEMHDGTTKDWGPYLAEAERNRGAAASIGLVRHLADNQGHVVRVIAPKRILVAFDPDADDVEMLRTAVLLMRTVALTSTGRFGVEEINTANESIREALVLIDDLDEAKRSANAITGHVEKIDRTVTRTMVSVQRELHQALNALTGAAGPETAPVAADDPEGPQTGPQAVSA